MKRREAIKLLGTSSLFYLSGCASSKNKNQNQSNQNNGFNHDLSKISPINRFRDEQTERSFSGDQPTNAHQILWDKDAFITSKGGLPEVSEKAKVVVIGGGMSGMIAAYELRKYNPIVLEQASRFGGNSKGESWQGLHYSIGSAYLSQPAEGGKLDKLFKEVGAYDVITPKSDAYAVLLNDKLYEHFLGGTTKESLGQFRKLRKYLHSLYRSENGYTYPEIPVEDPSQRDYINTLDSRSFHAHVKALLGGSIHPHLETIIEYYCWSSFAGSAKEISAAAGLNFYSGETGDICVAQGGNSGILEKILFKLAGEIPHANLRNESIVFDVNHKEDGVEVSYADYQGNVKVIKADYVVMACPKFIVNKILNNIEEKRVAAINQLKYRSFLLCNVLVNKPATHSYYDVYFIGNGKVDMKKTKEAADKQLATDMAYANFSDKDDKLSVLSLYRAIPYDGARPKLLAPDAYQKYEQEFMGQTKELLGPLGYSEKDLVDIRLTRWGHPLPLAQKGLFVNKIVDQVHKPFGERVFFAEQDNWMIPALETCAAEAFRVSEQIKKRLS